MAKSNGGMIELRGRVRDLVFRKTKFGTTVSSFNTSTYENKKWTEKQQVARSKFSKLCKLAKVFRTANDLGFRLEMGYMSQPCFVRHNYAVMEIRDDDTFTVDYERICMSHGTLSPLLGLCCEVIDGDLEIGWKWNKGDVGNGGDRVAVVIYCPDSENDDRISLMGEMVMSKEKVRRDMQQLTMKVPSRWHGLQVYCYAFAFDVDGKSSNSQYVGSFEGVESSVVRSFSLDVESVRKPEFVGVEQDNRVIDGISKRCFIINFRDDDELIEEVLVEPTEDEDFESRVVNGVRYPSKAELITRRMRDLIREVNPKLFANKYSTNDSIRANSWDELCRIITDALRE